MTQIALIDDEPLFTDALAYRITSALGSTVEVHEFDRPRRLTDFESVGELSHAVVDLSFGPLDLDASELQPEGETGLDAVLLLESLAPECRIVVVTTMGAPLSLETACAIRQTRPDIVFLNKADRRLPQQITAFIEGQAEGGVVLDNGEFGSLLGDVASCPRERITEALLASTSRRSISRLLLAMADRPTEPTVADLQAVTGWKPQTVKNYLQELGARLVAAQVIDRQLAGLSLWSWARSRRPLLKQVLPPLGEA